MMFRSEIYRAIDDERERQDELHPKWDPDLALPVLMEEVGEAAKAWLNLISSTKPFDVDRWSRYTKDEIIQIAAVCVRWLEEDF